VKRPNVETALAEALYLTDVERNGDVVEMTSYAPMLCKDGHSNWNPDMIYFSNTAIRTTPAYEIQRLFSVYSGDRYLTSHLLVLSSQLPALSHRVGASVVKDSKTGKCYLKLVNALPSTLKITVEGLQMPQTVKCEQFTGAIDDQKAKAEMIETSEPATLPPYSLRVIEL
jgi:alpha-L-arabinofuranosidase